MAQGGKPVFSRRPEQLKRDQRNSRGVGNPSNVKGGHGFSEAAATGPLRQHVTPTTEIYTEIAEAASSVALYTADQFPLGQEIGTRVWCMVSLIEQEIARRDLHTGRDRAGREGVWVVVRPVDPPYSACQLHMLLRKRGDGRLIRSRTQRPPRAAQDPI